ncbi:hypothetical protein PVAND_006953 [Polypedilum vanderplanki]|uniref:DH domain-containing protein n=1 Tax=Polypedilum vanderplanki TaxID=319348 RepID=A0A9J6C4R3_POLVA|nr:hypothetical protein PVAND_006953 [Polypedilum vanderplanki]
MLGNQSNVNGNKPVYRNARLFGPNCTVGSNNINSNSSKNDFNDDDFSEYMKNDVPEMKILPMEYVTKVKSKPKCPPPPPPPKNKCKCAASTPSSSPENNITKPSTSSSKGLKVTINAPESARDKKSSDKYLVYKRKHSIFGTSKDVQNGKLKYVSDNDKATVDAAIQDAQKAKEGRRKYLIFDSKKSNSNKFETIQYYFDNKSYEKYVDTKLYGKLNQISSPISNDVMHKVVPEVDEEENDDEGDDTLEVDSDIDMRGFENSRSWEYRDNAKTESKLKLFESRQFRQQEFNKKSAKSEGSSTSGASSCSEVSLKRQNCRLKPQQKLTTSKSIDDLSSSSNNKSKTNLDVKRINQLFENAKQNQIAIAAALKSNVDNKEKYKIHRKVRDDVSIANMNGDNEGGAPLSRENVKKYHRSSTDLSIKASPTLVSCGFKNCKLPNCPISHHNDGSNSNTNNSSLASSSSVLLINERRSKFDENFIKKFEEMNKKRNNCAVRNNEITVNKTNISVNGKSNIIVNDTKNHFLATTPSCHDHDLFIINADSSAKEKEMHLKTNNQNKTTIKINDSCFVVNHNGGSNSFDVKLNNEKNKNIIELNAEKTISQTTNWDKNIRVKNNPQPKFNNKIDVNNKIKNEENSVKIYVIGNDSASSPTPSAALSSISSTSLDPSSSSSESSDKDDGYYDASSQGRSSSPEFSEMFKKLRDLCNMKNNKQLQQQMSQMKFGCDGALFWNNSYFDDDETDLVLTTLNSSNSNGNSSGNRKQTSSSSSSSSVVYACTKCHTTTEDLLSNYICICRNKVDYITRPLSSEGPVDSGVSESGENIFSPDGQSQTDFESRKLKRGHVLTELLETERIYVNEMRSILTVSEKKEKINNNDSFNNTKH